MESQGKPGKGAFQWNWGGWLGAQIGSTLWLVILGVLVLAESRWLGVVLILLGLIPNVVGLMLWHRRHALSPYPAVQALIAVCGACALLAMLAIRSADVDPDSVGLPSYGFLLIYSGLMCAFYVLERSNRNNVD